MSSLTISQFSGLPCIPALNDLKGIPQWVAWRYEQRNGKPTKPPIDAHTGRHANISDPRTWGTYEEAEKRARVDGLPGVGFVLSASDELTGFDLDKCRDPKTGKLKPWVQDILAYGETYAEVSPSGRGMRLIARGKIPAAIKCDMARVEMYATGRYLTITGHHLQDTPDKINQADRTQAACRDRAELHQRTWAALKRVGKNITRDVLTGKALVAKASGAIVDLNAVPRPAAWDASSETTEKSSFWRKVNSAALNNLDAWVPILFPGAVPRSSCIGGYRVSSDVLGRDLEEDLSITSRGIKDFGVHDMDDPRAGRRTPIELVLEHGEVADARAAAHWLCKHLGVPPENLGWRPRDDAFGAVNGEIEIINKSYSLVLVGGRSAILKETQEEPGGYTLLTHSAFEHWHANRHVTREGKQIPLSKHWMTHPDRRQYQGLTFAPRRDVPGYYNLWHGFTVSPRAGDCSKFLVHLFENVCQGNKDHFNWLLGWFAQLIQEPGEKLGTALVLRGKEGCGKSIVGKIIGFLLGRHYLPVSKPELVTGRFNGHLAHCLLLQAEEAFWAGDRAAAGALKDLITNDDLVLEFKGLEPVRLKNYTRVFATSNEDWVVPAGLTARRFAVLDVGEKHVGDEPYFAAIACEMQNGGQEALLHHLQQIDLCKVDLRSVPKTKALLEQKLHPLDPVQAWWCDMLMAGRLPAGCNETRCCPKRTLFDAYLDHANKTGIRRRAVETLVGAFVSKHVPGLGTREVRRIGRVYDFPPLSECRKAFATLIQQEVDWPTQDDWLNNNEDFPVRSEEAA